MRYITRVLMSVNDASHLHATLSNFVRSELAEWSSVKHMGYKTILQRYTAVIEGDWRPDEIDFYYIKGTRNSENRINVSHSN
jgi:hypothetical protein